MLLEFLFCYVLLESWSYYRFSCRFQTARKVQIPKPRAQVLEWADQHRDLVPNVPYHKFLEDKPLPDILDPHYKPLVCYGLLRMAYYVGTGWFLMKGYRRNHQDGLVYWTKGSGPQAILFLHGFGFGVIPYYKVFEQMISEGYSIIAPEFPVVCYDGRHSIPTLQDYSSTILKVTPPTFDIISNSFGSYIHTCILLTDSQRVVHQTFVEPVCFYPYFGSVLNFITVSLSDILRSPWARSTFVKMFSYALVSKDLGVLQVCNHIKTDVYWDAEQHLDGNTRILLSENDYIIESAELHQYFTKHHPQVEITILPNCGHGEAMFRHPFTHRIHK
jgi:pimeloyl-ACP methyl ester carboxylesterase